MALRNSEQNDHSGSDIFPLTAKFNSSSYVYYATVVEVAGEPTGTRTTLYLATTYSDGDSRYVGIDGNVNDVFEECLAARRENRHADFTKLEKPPAP